MSYHIAVDSCTDLLPEMKEDSRICRVPLTLIVGEHQIIDDETFDQKDFLDRVAKSPVGPSSACPSPHAFMEAFGDDDEDAFGITLSAELSGSYNSAMLGARELQKQRPDKKIHVFNSRSACCGQTLILMCLRDCLEAGMSFKETVETVEKYISEQTTLFVLESLEHLRKNGRLTHLESVLVNALNIKPVMSSTPEGNIQKVGMGRGIKKGLVKMIDHVGKTAIHPELKRLAISHCNCAERAAWVKAQIAARYPFKSIVVVDTSGVGSLYAGDGGIVMAY